MDEKHIVRGTWRALVRMLGLPLVLLLVLHMAASGLSRESWRRIGSQVRAGFSTNAATNSTQSVTVQTWTSNAGSLPMSDSGLEAAVTIFVAGSAGACAAGNLIALCWFGMWMGMTSRTANLATLKTFLFVQIIPGFVLYFATTVATMLILLPRMFKGGSTGPVQFTVWYPLMTAALTAGLTLSKDIGFFIWSRKKLYSSFREQASRTLGQRLLAVPPPIMARAVSAPPVIPAPS